MLMAILKLVLKFTGEIERGGESGLRTHQGKLDELLHYVFALGLLLT